VARDSPHSIRADGWRPNVCAGPGCRALARRLPPVESGAGGEGVGAPADSLRRLEDLRQLQLVWIASGSCSACADERLPAVVRGAVAHVGQMAERGGSRFTAVGVGIDVDPERGLKQLRRFGEFDELLVGSGWLGAGAFQYIWQRHVGQGTVPQILVVERDLESLEALLIERRSTVLRRIVGVDQLLAWQAAGFPVPRVDEEMRLPEARDSAAVGRDGS